MNILSGLRIYMSGAIEHDTSPINWRTPVKKVLQEKFNLKVFDPFADPKQNWTKDVAELRKNKDYEGLRKIAKWFVRKDLEVVNRSDILIAYVPEAVPTVGTCHEIVNSDRDKKVTLLVCPQGKEKTALWYWGIIPIRFIFGSWEELYHYLDEVNNGIHKDDERWQFVHYMQDYLN